MLRTATMEELIDEIYLGLQKIIVKKDYRDKLEKRLGFRGFKDIDVVKFFDDPWRLAEETEEGAVIVFADELTKILKLVGLPHFDLNKYFSDIELKNAASYKYEAPKKFEKQSFPKRFKRVIEGGKNSYTLTISARDLAALKLSGMLNWNPNTQREAVRKQIGGEIVSLPKFYPENRRAIKENILKGEQLESTIVLNMPYSSTFVNEELKTIHSGDVYYDEESMELLLDDGSLLDIIDGAHRIQACADALTEDWTNEYLDSTKFTLKIMNVDDKEAKRYQAQQALMTPISDSRITELAQERKTDQIVEALKNNKTSELKGRISSSDTPDESVGELTTYEIMAISLNAYFGDFVKNNLQVMQATEYLESYYMYLLGYYEKDYNKNDSVLFDKRMFVFLNKLAADMYEYQIPASEVTVYVNPANFKRETLRLKDDKMYRSLSYKSINALVSKKNTKEMINFLGLELPAEVH